MATTSGNLIVPLTLALLLAGLTCLQCGSASPVILSSVSEASNTVELEPSAKGGLEEMQANNKHAELSSMGASIPVAPQKLPVKVSNADKLRRSLTSFINQHNPASFFVPAGPALLQQQAKGGGGGTQSVVAPSSLVQGDASPEAIIKGPNRLVQTRPIGGATRWGR